MVFKLLGRTPKCPRGCLRSPWGDERGGGAEQALNFPSNRTTPHVAVLYIGVQGKILFALRGLLLKKKLENHLPDHHFQLEPVLSQVWGRLFELPFYHRMPVLVSIPGDL